MDIKLFLNEAIVDLLALGVDPKTMSAMLLDEDYTLYTEEGDPVTLNNVLLETVRRRRMKIGGVNITTRKMGRPNPQRSMKAKMAARRHSASRKRAAQMFARSSRAKQMRRVVSRMHRRSGPPRAGRRPRTFRPRRRRY